MKGEIIYIQQRSAALVDSAVTVTSAQDDEYRLYFRTEERASSSSDPTYDYVLTFAELLDRWTQVANNSFALRVADAYFPFTFGDFGQVIEATTKLKPLPNGTYRYRFRNVIKPTVQYPYDYMEMQLPGIRVFQTTEALGILLTTWSSTLVSLLNNFSAWAAANPDAYQLLRSRPIAGTRVELLNSSGTHILPQKQGVNETAVWAQIVSESADFSTLTVPGTVGSGSLPERTVTMLIEQDPSFEILNYTVRWGTDHLGNPLRWTVEGTARQGNGLELTLTSLGL